MATNPGESIRTIKLTIMCSLFGTLVGATTIEVAGGEPSITVVVVGCPANCCMATMMAGKREVRLRGFDVTFRWQATCKVQSHSLYHQKN